MRQIALARPALTGADAGRLLMMQALVLKVMGRRLDALAAYQRALPLIRRAGDVRLLAELLGNRGVIQMDLGMLDKAERDLREAAALFESTGGGLHAAITLHNLGCVAALRGDIPGAIATFDSAEESYAAHRDVPRGVVARSLRNADRRGPGGRGPNGRRARRRHRRPSGRVG